MASPNYDHTEIIHSNKRKYAEMLETDSQPMDEDYDFDSDELSEDEYTVNERIEGLQASLAYAYSLITELEKKLAMITRMVTLNTDARQPCKHFKPRPWEDNPPSPPSALVVE